MAKSVDTAQHIPSVQQVPSAPLVPRDAGGIGGALFMLLDDVMSGKNVPPDKVNAVCRIATAYGRIVRTAIAQERHRATGASGLVINHDAGKPAATD